MADQAEEARVPFHLPVLQTEVVDRLGVRSGGVYVDATVGDGGHALALLRASSPLGCVCGIDLDPRSLVRAEQRLAPFGSRFTPVLGSYASMVSLVQGAWGGEVRVEGILLDLGISSRQVDGPGFGFSFQRDEPLDMRFNPDADVPTAAELVNTWPEARLASVLREFGEEPRAAAIARSLVRGRPVRTTAQLAELAGGRGGRRGPRRTHPATRTFQALRIAVNDELNTLEEGLKAAVELLAPEGRVGIISYHSLEDRLVKNFLAREGARCICPPGLPVCVCNHKPTINLVNRRIIRPSVEEVAANPRSRSSRLRVAQRLQD
ncbi:MAG: 16S rRNA (cytosine(1402)-N(4))-methyltransferase RsmH [Chloroflexi bacterium]|nr:16S rRNA (cytosine(1402)-N(4))-methyltransferase RsmH [Chloroflexota bacterium]